MACLQHQGENSESPVESTSLSDELPLNVGSHSSQVNDSITSQGLTCEQSQSVEDAGKKTVAITVSGESL